ncbi:MAG: hypothetical protein KF691_07710 [Phycisphaeraceae bacterium]|nr:hypothetical protein [Phycisphaeraceae bacterium]
MSRSAALFWVLTALVLGIIVWLTQPRPVLQSASVQLLPDFSPSQVSQIEIEWPDGERARLDRAPFDPYWILLSQPKDNARTPPWPAETGRVQGLLRLLAEAREGGDARAMPTALFLTLSRGSGSPIRLAVDPNPLGGTGSIARLGADGRVAAVAEVDEQFVRALAWSAIDSWRSKDLLFWPTAATTELRSRSGSATFDVVKAGGAWIMRDPIAIKADAAGVEGALLLLSKSAVDRFLPPNATPEDAWASPARVIHFAAKVPGTRDHLEIEQAMELGTLIDSNSRMVRITARQSGESAALWGPEIAIVNEATLRAIPTDAGMFVSRISLDLPPADIASVEIRFSGRRAVVERDSSGKFGEADPPVRELLRLLCETPSSGTRILDAPPPPSDEFVEVRVFGPKSDPLASFLLRVGSIPSRVSGAPSVPAIEIVYRAISRTVPWQRPGDFLATLRGLTSNTQQR